MQVRFENDNFVAFNKPSGTPSQDDLTGDMSLHRMAEDFLDKMLFVVHRIDRPVSGVIFFAKSEEAAFRFADILKHNSTQKNYWALVNTKPAKNEATLQHYLEHDTKRNRAVIHDAPTPNAKSAELNYTLLASSDNYHLLEITLHTGRFHQIRAQLAHIGSPIKGDVKYGARRAEKDKSIGLHALSFKFQNEKGTMITVTAPPPDLPIWNYFVESLNFVEK